MKAQVKVVDAEAAQGNFDLLMRLEHRGNLHRYRFLFFDQA